MELCEKYNRLFAPPQNQHKERQPETSGVFQISSYEIPISPSISQYIQNISSGDTSQWTTTNTHPQTSGRRLRTNWETTDHTWGTNHTLTIQPLELHIDGTIRFNTESRSLEYWENGSWHLMQEEDK